MAEEIFEKAKKLSPDLQKEALQFVHFLAEGGQPIDPDSQEFTSELMRAFAEAKQDALERITTRR